MNTILRIFAVALIAAVLAGCGASHSEGTQGLDFQLKMYKVPAAQSKAIAGKLDGILASPEFLVGTKTHTTMRATTPFPGTVLVLAPASVQPSIATAVAELATAAGSAGQDDADKAKTPESIPLRVQFWVVQAKGGSGDDGTGLQALEPTLKQLRASLGASHFVLEDSATVAVTAPRDQNATQGNGSVITSRGRDIEFHASGASQDAVDLNLQFHNTTREAASQAIPELKTTLTVRPGEFVVLAEAIPADAPANTPNATLMNLLVVRVDRADATAR